MTTQLLNYLGISTSHASVLLIPPELMITHLSEVATADVYMTNFSASGPLPPLFKGVETMFHGKCRPSTHSTSKSCVFLYCGCRYCLCIAGNDDASQCPDPHLLLPARVGQRGQWNDTIKMTHRSKFGIVNNVSQFPSTSYPSVPPHNASTLRSLGGPFQTAVVSHSGNARGAGCSKLFSCTPLHMPVETIDTCPLRHRQKGHFPP